MLERTRTAGTHFWDWVDNRAVAHRIVLLISIWLTVTETWHAWEFAQMSKFDGQGTALIIAAVLVPLMAFQKFAFEMYSKKRGG